MAIEKIKFDYDCEELGASLKEIETNAQKMDGDFPEVPAGKYEVKIEKIELGSTKDGRPMGKIQFRISEGDYKKQCLFLNQVLVGTDKETGKITAFGIHKLNTFLRSLDTNVEIDFEDFNQYANMLLDVAEEAETLSYDIEYSLVNGFPVFKVLEVFED